MEQGIAPHDVNGPLELPIEWGGIFTPQPNERKCKTLALKAHALLRGAYAQNLSQIRITHTCVWYPTDFNFVAIPVC
jgi:hypothetical protein